ncbi:DUF5658 family protein [Candidatus Parcubacteria bacterium]|nr:DUF5658 family protein [Candidatus Parcubacteria bacterium]
MNKYSKIILLIALIDMITTIAGIHLGYCKEKAPLMLWFFETGGILSFVAGKMAITLSGVAILEIIWQKNLICRNKMRRYYQATIIAYCLLYVIGFFAANYLFIWQTALARS